MIRVLLIVGAGAAIGSLGCVLFLAAQYIDRES